MIPKRARTLFLGKNPITWVAEAIRRRGLWRSCALVWHAVLDTAWDKIHRTETLSRIQPEDLETESGNKAQATAYGATRARPLSQLLQQLDLPRNATFVDLGSGKGRVVLIAATCGFRKIVGIDFSAPLCEIARRNIDSFQRHRRLNAEIVIVHSDVVLYEFQGDETVFFLYDPFSAAILGKVLENLRRSLEEVPRPIWIIYNSPRHHDVMERSGLFTSSQHREIGGIEFCIYHHAATGNAGTPAGR